VSLHWTGTSLVQTS